SVVEIERTISRLQAARDGMLAVGARLALDIARQDDTDGRDDGRGVDGRIQDGTDLALRAVAAELGAALRVSDRTVQRRMGEASFLVEQFPLLWA
ncbi:HNH endonuclease, partial [Microbacterium sp. SD291]|nr:HNH endonuclease [Microbacterium sp. SD291]